MENLKIFPYRMKAAISAKLIAEELDIYRIKKVSSPNWAIINWGQTGYNGPNATLNKSSAVAKATNKLKTAKAFKEANIMSADYTTEKYVVEQWLAAGFSVVARKKLSGLGGAGIEIIGPSVKPLDIPDALMYNKYIKKSTEYRVHVFRGKIIDYSQKKRMLNFPGAGDPRIRSHLNGYVFCKNNIDSPPPCVLGEAAKAVAALGLDFGGVDVGYNNFYKEPTVYEVNTAPGIEGSTVLKYAKAFKEWYTQ